VNKITVISIFIFFSDLAYGQSCGDFNGLAMDESKTIDARYEAAKNYKSCLANSMVPGAEPPGAAAAPAAPLPAFAMQEAENQEEELKGKKAFLGKNFGVGFGVSFYDNEIVDDADIVSGVVVAKSKKKEEARVLLEFHTLLACNDKGRSADFGCGPFVALAAKDDDVLGGVGLGWLWSWRDKTSKDGSGFSVGIGAIVDNDVKDLAKGFKVGSAPPVGETSIRYTDETKTSYLLFVSNNF